MERRLAAIMGGQFDLTHQVPLQFIAQVKAAPNLTVQEAQPNFQLMYYGYKITRPMVSDKRVREAMNLAIDRVEVAQSVFAGKADPAPIPLGLSWSFKEIGLKVTPEMLYPYDPARAKKLLADAGFASGFPLEVYAYQLPGLPEGKTTATITSTSHM